MVQSLLSFLLQCWTSIIQKPILVLIHFSAYEEMIAGTVKQIKDVLFEKYNDLVCLHIYHSTGEVKVGQHSLLVMVSSGHRKQAFAACQECVELIKEKLPVWKKELYHDGSHDWLKN